MSFQSALGKELKKKAVAQLRALTDSIERGDQLIDEFSIEDRKKHNSNSYQIIEREITVKTICCEDI